ncbi:CDP-alcohol phosphatidyltransferase family protein [Arthrobacter sp. UYEF3]|uniref:CDP-alcohol phosphatidyltransferase family protein n=1 Tax=Arthrobacter sp. UYEF3 TaxID=1756365 RepID=UPI00339A4262
MVTYRASLLSLASAQKAAAPGAPPYSVYVNRRVGRYFAAAAHRAGMKPNMVTVASAVLTFSGIGLIADGTPSWWLGACVWILLAVGYALDSADGQVARLCGGGSVAGEWLDHVIDSAKISCLHLAVLATVYQHFQLGTQALLVPMGFTVVAAVSFFAMILNDHLKAIEALKSGRKLPGGSVSKWKSLLLIPTDYGILCLLFLFLGAPYLFFGLYCLLFLANAGHLFLASIKWFNDMKRLAILPTDANSQGA